MAETAQAEWKQTTENLPDGCAAAWHAMVQGRALAGIFRLMSGETHMLCYQVMGDLKPTVERFPSVELALDRANVVLSTRVCMPR